MITKYIVVYQYVIVFKETPINNQRLAHRFKVIDELALEEKEVIITVLDAMITKSKMDTTRSELSKASL